MIKHPSGKPLRIEKRRDRSIWRVPDYGFVTPRLNMRSDIQAIGFNHSYQETDNEGGMRGMRKEDRR